MVRSVCWQNGAIAVYAKQLSSQPDLRVTTPPFLWPEHHRQPLAQAAGAFQVLAQSRVAYEVDLFGRIHRAIEAASANAESVATARDSVRVLVAANTARSYGAICALGEELEVARRSLDVVSHEAEITRQRFDAGAGSELDLTRAQALAAQVR